VDLSPGRCLATGHLQHGDLAIPSGHNSEASHLILLCELEVTLGHFLDLLDQGLRECIPARYCHQSSVAEAEPELEQLGAETFGGS
jgi:hypothetical protein